MIYMPKKSKKLFQNFMVAVAIILIWRGIWYFLDYLDLALFGGSHIWTAVVGVAVGILILYIPDKNLSELGKL